MSACLRGRYEVAVWSLLKRTANVKNMIGLIIPSKEDIDVYTSQAAKEKNAMLSEQSLIKDSKSLEADTPPIDQSRSLLASGSGLGSAGLGSGSGSGSALASLEDRIKVEDCVYDVIFRTRDIISSFAVNPLDSGNFVLSTPQSVVEIDVDTAKIFAQV